jgi:hypothetical protein
MMRIFLILNQPVGFVYDLPLVKNDYLLILI